MAHTVQVGRGRERLAKEMAESPRRKRRLPLLPLNAETSDLENMTQI